MSEILGIAITPNGNVHTLETGGRIVCCMPAPAEVLHLGRERMDGFSASADGALHAVGGRYHTNASGAWKSEKVERKNRVASMVSVWARTPEDVWIGDASGEVLRRVANEWTSLETGFPEGQTVHFVGGSGGNDVYVGGIEVRHFDGTKWRGLKAPAASLFLDIAYFRGRTYVAGHDGLYEVDGATLRPVAGFEQTLYSVAATATELYLATGGPVLAWDGMRTRVALEFGGYRVATNGTVVAAGRENEIHVVGQGTFASAPKEAKPKEAKPKGARSKDTTAKAKDKVTPAKKPVPASASFQCFRFFEQKFFEVAVVGTDLVTRSGFIGKDATENVRTYATAAAAEAARDKLIAEKRSKGFRPV